VLVLWAVYRFEIERLAGPPWILPLPSHIKSLRALFEGQDRIAFLRGHLKEGGWWWYSLYVFLIKTPLPLVAAVLISVYDELPHFTRRGRHAWLQDVPLWLFPVIYWGITMWGGMHIGYRHLLPTFPFVYVLVGRTIAHAWSRNRISQTTRTKLFRLTTRIGVPNLFGFFGPRRWPRLWITVVLTAWYVLGTWQVYPYTLAYFNELAGGPANGYRHVVDSNLDWGHSFKALAQYMRQEEIEEVSLSYWTWVDPALYGVRYTPLPPAPQTEKVHFPSFAPPAGVYAISATTLQGILLHDTNLYEWFRHQPPIAQPGYGLLVYRVEQSTPAPTWVGQCATPAPPLPLSEIERGFGGQVQRIAYFDCTQAWLYPNGGRTAGWFVLHQEALGEASAWITPHLADARLSYAHSQPGVLPPFSIYEWTSSPLPTPATSVFIPSDPDSPVGGLPFSTPVSFDGPLVLQGYRVAPAGEHTLELQTWWEVNSPSTRPFSLMGHLVDSEGHVIGVADGLGVPLTEMRQGDWIVQRHRFPLPETLSAPVTGASSLGALWLQTGGYWLDTMERWPVLADGSVVGDRVILTSVELSRQ